MGRLSTQYAGQPITYRVPYVMNGFITFPDVADATPWREQPMNANALLHTVDKPFEVHRLIPVAVATEGGSFATTSAQQEQFLSFMQVRMRERSRNQSLTASFTPVLNLIKGTAERSWEFADPMVLARGEGLLVDGIMKQLAASFFASPLRLYISLQGYLLIMPPAFDQR